ncbi:MAG: hypothetical protein K0B08_10540, partial [Bacteroidales bacterium]|nr:hypothetical protein [Bacteroidales bacterium]
TNGILTFGSSGASSNANENLFNTSTPNSTITPWWDYLNADGSAAISYKTEGVAPNRVFTAEWKNILTFFNVANARISFQLKLYEGSGIIEFHYGNVSGTKHNNSEGASIGIQDDVGGSGHFIEATTGSTTTGISDLKSDTNWPTVNYRFSPPETPAFTEQFHHIAISKTGQTVNFDIDVEIAGFLTISPGATLVISEGKTVSIISVIP